MAKIIIANWKMNPPTLPEALALAKESDSEGLVIAPPFPFLPAIQAILKESALGAQDLFFEDRGAFTGEVSGLQLASFGVQYVILGHSERRIHQGETDALIAEKVRAAIRHHIVPILCIGETREEKEGGKKKEVLGRKLKEVLARVSDKDAEVILAYEPIWAISTMPNAEPDTPENAMQMIGYMKELCDGSGVKLKARFIYGGSVNEKNAEGFLKQKTIEGALVGGASLKAKEIKNIVAIAKKYE